jgi:hypothetical protein
MRISHFPDFLLDETVYSVASRYLDRMQFHSHAHVCMHFFGSPSKRAGTDLPSNLEHLVQALPPSNIYTSDMIIDRYTLFPLYAPFLASSQATTLRERMKGNGIAVHAIAGIAATKVPQPQFLRYCPLCVDADREAFGECYWHRVHQAPGVLVCPLHECMLVDSSIHLRLGNTMIQFHSAERSVNTVSPRLAPAHKSLSLIQLAQNVLWLLEQSISLEPGFVQQQYKQFLTNHDLVTFGGKVRYTKLKEAFSDYYPADLLEDLGCSIADSSEGWLANWTTMQHPLHHLLFIQFLGLTPEHFLTQTPPAVFPFGNGPWPCLNPLCSHYKELVIRSYRAGQQRKQPLATFACHCGFTYSRAGPDSTPSALFRIGKIVQYGHVWDQQLTTYWLDHTISTEQVARLMHTNVDTIQRQAARLDLPFAPVIQRRGKRPKIYTDTINERRDGYRALWEEALKEHANTGVGKICRVAHKAYSWLIRYDPDWLSSHWPATAARGPTNERLMLIKKQQMHDRYSHIDADLAKVVRETAEAICTRSDFPIQVTRQLLFAQVDDRTVLRSPSVIREILPLTADTLSEVIETHAAFIWRKLRWAVRSFLIEERVPSYREFFSRAHIGANTARKPPITQLIQRAYSSLSTGTPLDDRMPQKIAESEKREGRESEQTEARTDGSFADICLETPLILPVGRTCPCRQVYDPIVLLLLTVASVVSGAETCHAIEHWSYQNQEVLRRLGLPEDRFPHSSILKKIYARTDINRFETILDTWLCENFFPIQNKTDETKVHSRSVYVPGLRLLRSYQHVASAVVAKLR